MIRLLCCFGCVVLWLMLFTGGHAGHSGRSRHVQPLGCSGNISQASYNGLKALYDSTDGDNWHWNTTDGATKWVFPSGLDAPCSTDWYGIECVSGVKDSGCELFSLTFEAFGLHGSLPTEIGGFSDLRYFIIEKSRLTGTIPTEVGGMSALLALVLSDSFLSHTIPETVYTISNLESFELQFNSMTGSISSSVGQVNLNLIFDLGSNYFTSTLPTELGKLLAMEKFLVNNNFMNGTLPSELLEIRTIQTFNVEVNSFSGSLSSSIGGATSLLLLELEQNSLTGSIPSELGLLTGLTDFRLFENLFSNSLPLELCNLTSVSTFEIEQNMFTGNLPGCLSRLNLSSFEVFENMFSGPISTEFCTCSAKYFMAYDNLFSGPLPDCIGEMADVEVLYVFSNMLSSSLPTSFGGMSSLMELEAYSNLLSGRLSESLCNLSSIQQILIGPNYFSNSLPTCLNVLSAVTEFEIENNFISGPFVASQLPPTVIDLGLFNNIMSGLLPTEVANLVQVQYLYIQDNNFEGTIGSEFALLTNLRAFQCSYNSLSGTIPEIFGGMSALEIIYVSNCNLYGPLPTQLVTKNLQYIDVANNSITGSIPASYYYSSAVNFYANGNFLTGTMSKTLWDEWIGLKVLSLSNNLLSGELPNDVDKMISLEAMFVASNYFSGTLPVHVGDQANLRAYQVSDTFISGAIPSELSDMHRLESLNISGNFLSGNLDKLFQNESSLPRLIVIDVSQNGFTGEVPSALFDGNPYRSRLLTDALLYSNCFDSSIPTAVCSAANLTTMIFDSMSSAPACQHNFGTMRSIFKVVISSIDLGGTIPDCVWSMPALHTLHISGNGLHGTLGEIAVGATSLIDVSLASNRLIGSIPDSWQTWGRFTQLDLSSNKLTGVLVQNFNISAANTNTDLSVNRISGVIPGAFIDSQNINILDGNLFQCGPSTVPKYDPNSKQYVCGSDDFNISLILFVCLGACGIVAVAALYQRVKQVLSANSAFLLELERCESENGTEIGHFVGFLNLIELVARWCSVCAVGCVGLAMIAYIILKTVNACAQLYSTHTQQYLWITTVTYLHGVTPTVLIFIFLGISVIFAQVMLKASPRVKSESNAAGVGRITNEISVDIENTKSAGSAGSTDTSNSATALTGGQSQARIMMVPVLIMGVSILIHIAVTVSVNLAYVYALIKGVTPGLLLFLQILLSAVKLAWNRYFVHRPHFGAAHLPLRIELLCQCFMTLFTFLASPIIATFFLDNTCFRYVILGQPTVDSTFIITPFDCPVSCFMDPAGGFPCYSGCGVSRNVTDVATTSVVPSWLYSYQCASSVLTNYIPVLVFAYVWSGLLYPVVRTTLTLRGNKITTWVQQLRSDSRVFSAAEGNGLARRESDELGSVRAPKPLLRSSIVLCRLCLNVAVMLTYGLACPLLSIAVCADSWTQIGVLQVLQYKLAVVIGLVSNSEAVQSGSSNPSENSTVEPISVISDMHARSEGSDVAASDRPTERSVEPSMVKFSTISKAAEPSEISTLLHVSLVLEAESRAMFAGVSGSMWMAIVVSSLFWAFFLFDMMGDVYGNAIGGVVFALCFVYTIGIYALAHHWPVQCGVGKLCRRDGRTRETLVEAMRGSEVNNEGF
jgi:hypothetical protein